MNGHCVVVPAVVVASVHFLLFDWNVTSGDESMVSMPSTNR